MPEEQTVAEIAPVAVDIEELALEGDGAEDDTPLDIPAAQRQVLTKSSDPEIKALHDKARRGRLVPQPEFQRHFVWDRKKSSRLIESALLNIPLPTVYLSE